MKKYNLNNVKGEVIKALVKRMDKDAIRAKWAVEIDVCREVAAKIADAVVAA